MPWLVRAAFKHLLCPLELFGWCFKTTRPTQSSCCVQHSSETACRWLHHIKLKVPTFLVQAGEIVFFSLQKSLNLFKQLFVFYNAPIMSETITQWHFNLRILFVYSAVSGSYCRDLLFEILFFPFIFPVCQQTCCCQIQVWLWGNKQQIHLRGWYGANVKTLY